MEAGGILGKRKKIFFKISEKNLHIKNYIYLCIRIHESLSAVSTAETD
jgi:hypothetical protein